MRKLFEQAILRKLNSNAGYVDVNAGDIHREVGGYPGTNHRMPVCCSTMRDLMKADDEIIASPPKGNGASLTIRYYKKNH